VLFELLLLMVAVPASYWGVLLLRRHAGAPFAWMLTATGAAGWISYIARRNDGPPIVDAIGAVAIGAGVCLMFVGPMMRRAARWAVATDRLKLASVFIELGDLLQPGTSGPDDKASLAALRDVRAGEVDGAIEALRAARAKAPAELHRAFDERIALLYVVAMRWSDAIAHAEATLFPTTPIAAEGAGNTPLDVARSLGMSPPVWVELTAAYGRLGQLDRAAEMAARFDLAAKDTAAMAWLVHRVRLVYLAAAGRVAPVQKLLAQRATDEIKPASRLYWAALASERAGDRAAARTAYEQALGHARRVPRVEAAIKDALDHLDRAAPADLSPEAAKIADELAATEIELPRAPRRMLPHVTTALVAANLLVAVVTAWLVGAPNDIGAVVRAGARVRAAVGAGEWWRVPQSVFVHVGWVHLAVNVIGLWSLGRMAEGLFGHARTLAIYAFAGLAGAMASHAFGAAGVSAGASGAIFGLLGALVIELVVAGKQYPRPGRNALVGALVFVALVQLCMGLLYAAIDQWGHGVGLAAGATAGALLSPHGPAANVRGWIARVIAALGALLFAASLVLAAITPYGATLAREGTVVRPLGELTIDVPSPWLPSNGFLDDPDRLGGITADHKPIALDAAFAELRTNARAELKELGFTDAVVADDTVLALPRDWRSAELIATFEDDLGETQRFRAVVFAHADGDQTIRGLLYIPDLLAKDAHDELAAVITSTKLATLAKLAPGAPRQ